MLHGDNTSDSTARMSFTAWSEAARLNQMTAALLGVRVSRDGQQ